MEKFRVGDRVKVIGTTSAAGRKYFGRVGIITRTYSDCCNLDLETEGMTGGLHYHEIEPFPSASPYSSLRARIEALDNGWTKGADDILAELTKSSLHHFLVEQDTEGSGYIYLCHYKSGTGLWLDQREVLIKPSATFRFDGQYSKNRAFKQALLWLLDHSDIKKDDKQEKIEALQKEQLELKAKLSILDHKIEEL